jgi:hypothetical protein
MIECRNRIHYLTDSYGVQGSESHYGCSFIVRPGGAHFYEYASGSHECCLFTPESPGYKSELLGVVNRKSASVYALITGNQEYKAPVYYQETMRFSYEH